MQVREKLMEEVPENYFQVCYEKHRFSKESFNITEWVCDLSQGVKILEKKVINKRKEEPLRSKQEDFELLNKTKLFYKYSLRYVLNMFPKTEYTIKRHLEDNILYLIESIVRGNVTTDKEFRKRMQERCLSSISLLDMFIGISLEKKVIDYNKFNTFVSMLNELRKMTYGWIKAT